VTDDRGNRAEPSRADQIASASIKRESSVRGARTASSALDDNNAIPREGEEFNGGLRTRGGDGFATAVLHAFLDRDSTALVC